MILRHTSPPAWQARAKEMHARGVSYAVVARIVGASSRYQVLYWCNDEYRERRVAALRIREAKRRKAMTPEQRERKRILDKSAYVGRIIGIRPAEVRAQWGVQ